jgi:succinyl-CoA synthetase beta subunit
MHTVDHIDQNVFCPATCLDVGGGADSGEYMKKSIRGGGKVSSALLCVALVASDA